MTEVRLSARPQSQVDVRCHQLEVTVGREHDQIVPTTELSEQRVDRADLEAIATTGVPQLHDASTSAPALARSVTDDLPSKDRKYSPDTAGCPHRSLRPGRSIRGREGVNSA